MGSARARAVPSEDADIARALSFVNTLAARPTASPSEKLTSYDALVSWGREEGLVKPEEADRLLARAKRRQDEAEHVVSRARELRELLHNTLTAMSSGRTPAADTLEDLSTQLSRWYAYGRLAPAQGALQWIYTGGNELDRVLWEVARAASRLLTSARLTRVRACAADNCGWWFLDETKNASRRWCDMKICGNRAKVRRFREKQRA